MSLVAVVVAEGEGHQYTIIATRGLLAVIANVFLGFIKQTDKNPETEQSLHVNLVYIFCRCHSKANLIISILKAIIYKGFWCGM